MEFTTNTRTDGNGQAFYGDNLTTKELVTLNEKLPYTDERLSAIIKLWEGFSELKIHEKNKVKFKKVVDNEGSFEFYFEIKTKNKKYEREYFEVIIEFFSLIEYTIDYEEMELSKFVINDVVIYEQGIDPYNNRDRGPDFLFGKFKRTRRRKPDQVFKYHYKHEHGYNGWYNMKNFDRSGIYLGPENDDSKDE